MCAYLKLKKCSIIFVLFTLVDIIHWFFNNSFDVISKKFLDKIGSWKVTDLFLNSRHFGQKPEQVILCHLLQGGPNGAVRTQRLLGHALQHQEPHYSWYHNSYDLHSMKVWRQLKYNITMAYLFRKIYRTILVLTFILSI